MTSGLTTSDINEIYASASRFTGNGTSLDEGYQLSGLLPHVKLLPHQHAAIMWMHERETQSSSMCDEEESIGGVLADEPGLGKTLSTLGLFLIGRSESMTLPNLIVSPTPIIAAQWKDEMTKYVGVNENFSSNLIDISKFKVFLYEGPPVPYDEAIAEEIVVKMNQAELVLTDLAVVKKELHYISAQNSGRSNRVNYISPLFKVQWRRVVVDEVQDVEGQATAAAKVLRSLTTTHRWGVSGTCITNGLDALRGLAIFLGIQPYCDVDWWNHNIEISKDASEENRSRRMAHLREFASLHMWRTRQVDISHQIPPQTHLPPTVIRASQSEFALLYPSVKSVSLEILKEVGKLGWKGPQDDTTLSNKDLKQLLSGGKSTNEMYRSAVSVRLMSDIATNNKQKGNNKAKDTAAFTGMSSVKEVLVNHSKWRIKADRVVNAYLNKLFGAIQFYSKRHMLPSKNNIGNTALFDVGSFEVLMKCYTLTKMFEKNGFHISAPFKLQVTFQLQRVWHLKPYIESAMKKLRTLISNPPCNENDISILRTAQKTLAVLKYERSVHYVAMLMKNYPKLRIKDSAESDTVAPPLPPKVIHVGLRAWSLILQYAGCYVSQTARKLSMSIISKPKEELDQALADFTAARFEVIGKAASLPHILIDPEDQTYVEATVSFLEPDIFARKSSHSFQIPFERSPNPSDEIQTLVRHIIDRDSENIFTFELVDHIETLKHTLNSFYYAMYDPSLTAKSEPKNFSLRQEFDQLVLSFETYATQIKYGSRVCDKNISFTMSKFKFYYEVAECLDTMEQFRMFFVEFLSSLLGYRSKASKLLEPLLRACEAGSMFNPESKFMSRLLSCTECSLGFIVQRRGVSRDRHYISRRKTCCPICLATEAVGEYKDHFDLVGSSSLSNTMKLLDLLQRFDDLNASSFSSLSSSSQQPKAQSTTTWFKEKMFKFRREASTAYEFCKSMVKIVSRTEKLRSSMYGGCEQESAASDGIYQISVPDLLGHSPSPQADAEDFDEENRMSSKPTVPTVPVLPVSLPSTTPSSSSASLSAAGAGVAPPIASSSSSLNREVAPIQEKVIEKELSLELVHWGQSSISECDHLKDELDTVLSFILYLETAAKLGNVKLKHEIARVTDDDLKCDVCATKDVMGSRCSLLLCSHILCSSCALLAQLNDEQEKSGEEEEEEEIYKVSSTPKGRVCPICSCSQPFQLSRAPLIRAREQEDKGDVATSDTDELYSDVIADDKDFETFDEIVDDNVDIEKAAVQTNPKYIPFDYSSTNIKVGAKVARLVKGFGAVLGFIQECGYEDDGIKPRVVIEDYCRTWLEPFEVETPSPETVSLPIPPLDDVSATGAVSGGKDKKRKLEEVDVSGLNKRSHIMTTTDVAKSSVVCSSGLSKNDWKCTRVMKSMDELEVQMALAVKLAGDTSRLTDAANVTPPVQHCDSNSTSPPVHLNKRITGFGSKMDELVKMVVELKKQDPNTKSLVFSQWPDALQAVQDAFTMNSVCSLILTATKAGEESLRRFRGLPPLPKKEKAAAKKAKTAKNSDSKSTVPVGNGTVVAQDECDGAVIQVLLMPLKSSNAGLSISEATHVFLLDTGLNRGLEIQALARVRRINSTQSTTVHRLIMENTIEAATWELLSRVERKEAIKEEDNNIKRCDVYAMFSYLTELYDKGNLKKMTLSEDIAVGSKEGWKQAIFSQLYEVKINSSIMTSSAVNYIVAMKQKAKEELEVEREAQRQAQPQAPQSLLPAFPSPAFGYQMGYRSKTQEWLDRVRRISMGY